MASITDNQQIIKTVQDNEFLEGKLNALHILFESYLELQIKDVKVLSTEEVLQTIRTLILNLEKQGGTSS